MSVALKTCGICGEAFAPDVRTRGFQKVCGKPACQRERKRLADERWRAKNPGYRDQEKMRRWAAGYPDYWRHWRAAHPAYVERNRQRTRERVRASRLMFAKQDAIRDDPVGYLEGLKAQAMFAKQDAMVPRVLEGILMFLTLREGFAKQKTIDPAGAALTLSRP
jgi:hypothetical protein